MENRKGSIKKKEKTPKTNKKKRQSQNKRESKLLSKFLHLPAKTIFSLVDIRLDSVNFSTRLHDFFKNLLLFGSQRDTYISRYILLKFFDFKRIVYIMQLFNKRCSHLARSHKGRLNSLLKICEHNTLTIALP